MTARQASKSSPPMILTMRDDVNMTAPRKGTETHFQPAGSGREAASAPTFPWHPPSRPRTRFRRDMRSHRMLNCIFNSDQSPVKHFLDKMYRPYLLYRDGRPDWTFESGSPQGRTGRVTAPAPARILHAAFAVPPC